MWVVDCSNYLYERVAANEWAAQHATSAAQSRPEAPRGVWRALWWRLTGGPMRERKRAQAASAAALQEAELYRRGLQGEHALIWFLAQRLDNRYLLLRNYTPPAPFRTGGDIDGVLMGPHGVTVFEVKAWRGVFRCNGDEWLFLPRDRSAWEPGRKNPIDQARYAADRVKGTLALAGLRDIQVDPVLVAAEPRMRVEVIGEPAIAIYQPFRDAEGLALQPRGAEYSYADLDAIYKALVGQTPVRR
ncbi:MAG TPA: nuclease-related domain-containing protein [Ktedonobacterales bacterium]